MRLHRDEILGLGAILSAAAYWAAADRIQVSLLADEVGADGVPKTLAVGLAACGALLVLATRLKAPVGEDRSEADKAEGRHAHLKALGLLTGLAVYVLLLPLIGYPIAIALLVAGAALYGGTHLRPRVALIAGLAGLGFWMVFDKALGIAMPLGAWMAP